MKERYIFSSFFFILLFSCVSASNHKTDEYLGLIITGSKNWDARYAAEVFKVGSAQSCILPQLPYLNLRRYHTQNGNLLCGGSCDICKTCLQLVDGVWTTSHNLKTSRSDHTSWTTSNGTLLIGGANRWQWQSTELVKTDGTTEVGTLKLKYKSRYACLIDEGDSFLLTGGFHTYDNVQLPTTRTSRYSSDSWLEDLDDLNTGRWNHACGWYTNMEGKRTNIVAGGNSNGIYVDSVELNVYGNNGWTYGSPLSKPMWGSRGVTVTSKFYITGGIYGKFQQYKYEDAIQLYEEDGWKTVGHMNVSRSFHGISAVHYEDFCPTTPTTTTTPMTTTTTAPPTAPPTTPTPTSTTTTTDGGRSVWIIVMSSLCGSLILFLVATTLVCLGIRRGWCLSGTGASITNQRDSENGQEMIKRRPGVLHGGEHEDKRLFEEEEEDYYKKVGK